MGRKTMIKFEPDCHACEKDFADSWRVSPKDNSLNWLELYLCAPHRRIVIEALDKARPVSVGSGGGE